MKALITFLAIARILAAATVSMAQYNRNRDGANTSERILTPANVASGKFAKLGSFAVDGAVSAQPLYIPGVLVRGSRYNLLIVATMHNSVYAFDAKSLGGAPL